MTARGGARPGAGRRSLYPGKAVRITVTLTQETHDRLVRLSHDRSCSFSDAFEILARGGDAVENGKKGDRPRKQA